MRARHKKLLLIVGGVAALSIATLLVIEAFRDNIVFFHSPTDIMEGKAARDRTLRIGGLVQQGSVQKSADGLKVSFIVTDLKNTIPVHYQGLLPDLFREGQGVIAQGRLQADNQFIAKQVLTKHDEKYMPPEVAKALEDAAKKP
jgi:cytochrome c-type biogenesis protein CcmE